MVSVLIPVLNEAANLDACIGSVSWSNDIVVVDSGSEDGSAEVTERAGARVVQFKWNGEFPKKKNWALEHVAWRNDWVLILDADERITPELGDEIRRELQRPRADGYFVNRRFMFLGRWIRHCGYYPSWNLRLFRHRLGRYEILHRGDTGSGDNEVHEHVVLNGRVSHLQNDMLHFAYPQIAAWIEKHNRYSNWEARVEVEGADWQSASSGRGEGEPPRVHGPLGGGLSCDEVALGIVFRRRLREWSRRMPFRPALRFFYSYILRRGFLDGYEGYILCRMLACYELMNVVKAYELRQARDRAMCSTANGRR